MGVPPLIPRVGCGQSGTILPYLWEGNKSGPGASHAMESPSNKRKGDTLHGASPFLEDQAVEGPFSAPPCGTIKQRMKERVPDRSAGLPRSEEHRIDAYVSQFPCHFFACT